MSIDTTYSLVFLVDCSKISKDELKRKVDSILTKHLLQIQLKIDDRDSLNMKLSVNGSLENIDACHQKLNKSAELDSEILTRWRDDAGKEIRERAYPLLANIELQLRRFINCAMIEVMGFNWWDSIVFTRVQERVAEIEGKHKKDSRFHNKIEFTQFDDLIAIVTHSFQEWPENHLISTEDLKNIISNCNSFTELKDEIDKKLSKISLWDDVFSKYFNDIKEWKELELSLQKMGLFLRNIVMHHRPMYLYELKKLKELNDKFNNVLATAKEKLDDDERITAKRISNNIFENIRKYEELAIRLESHKQAQQRIAEQIYPLLERIIPHVQSQQKLVERALSTLELLPYSQEDDSA